MKQRILEQARRTVDAFLQRHCVDTTLSVLAVMPEVDGDGDEFLWIAFKYDDSNGTEGLPDSLERIKMIGRLQTKLQDVDIDAFPVLSFIAESEVDEKPE